MTELSRQIRETTYLAVLRRGFSSPCEVIEADRAVRIIPPLGEALPLHSTAAGKAYLAFAAEDDVRALVPTASSATPRRPSPSAPRSCQQLKGVASSSYAVDMGEYLEDVRSVASPVRDYARSVVGVLAIAAPASRLSVERIDKEVAPAVVKSALELSSRLGFDGVRREARG
jgi:IclR family acetate operon transcriptional repressor